MRLPVRRLGEGSFRLQLRHMNEGFWWEKTEEQLETSDKIDTRSPTGRAASKKDTYKIMRALVAKKYCEDRLAIGGRWPGRLTDEQVLSEISFHRPLKGGRRRRVGNPVAEKR
jgi:hypothetical protein